MGGCEEPDRRQQLSYHFRPLESDKSGAEIGPKAISEDEKCITDSGLSGQPERQLSRSRRSAFKPATFALSAGEIGSASSSARPEAFAPNG